MKKYTVISRCKNPDKHIGRLTKRLEETRARSIENYSDMLKEKGRYLDHYKAGVTSGIANTSLKKARKVKIGDVIAVHGTVYEIKKQEYGYCIYWTSEIIFVKPLEGNDA